jgi:hypothetical protein
MFKYKLTKLILILKLKKLKINNSQYFYLLI